MQHGVSPFGLGRGRLGSRAWRVLLGLVGVVVWGAIARAAGPLPATSRTPAIAAWEAMRYGMFVHFGLSTFMREEYGLNTNATCADYRPTRLDPGQWARVAKDAGMKYALLTAKHCYGHCLWPSRYSDFTVAHSGDTNDVVRLFVDACRREGIKPGLYYLLGWDTHHQPRMTPDQYEEFCRRQLAELLTGYGPLVELWLDIPWDLGPDTTARLGRIYADCKRLQPDCLVLLNQSFWDGVGPRTMPVSYAKQNLNERAMLWPTDLLCGEVTPPPVAGHVPRLGVNGTTHYLPMETEDCLTQVWFHVGDNVAKPLAWRLQRYDEVTSRGANWLLDVAPDATGRIPQDQVNALMELRRALDGRPSRTSQ